ncbi:MAG: 50S ribosome-binding GTPase [Planctomycetaceae bacterium]|nr:50S ribosome-binding GTPase [Planctomycetaceae bacterium]
MTAGPECVFAILTGRGRGGVATFAIHGNVSLIDGVFTAKNGRLAAEQHLNRICFGLINLTDSSAHEEAVYCRTTENRAEIHCHGGPAVQRLIAEALQRSGVLQVSAKEFLSATAGPIVADAALVLAKSQTSRTARILLAQQERFPQFLEQISKLPIGERIAPLRESLQWETFGRHLTEPWMIVLCGPPNVGKSTLLNALVGYNRAIVFDQPGTTRDVLTAETAIEGWPMRFVDTAGLRSTTDELEQAGIEQGKQTLAQADLLLVLHDITQGPSDLPAEVSAAQVPRIDVWNKCDVQPQQAEVAPANDSVHISALKHAGLEPLFNRIVSRLVPDLPPADEVIPCSSQQATWMRGLLEAAEQGDENRWTVLVGEMTGL